MRFYLSGGMEFKDGLGKGWRETITKALALLGHIAVDPVKEEMEDSEATTYHWAEKKLKEDLDDFRHMVRLKMFRKDMRAIQDTDAVILLYDESVQRGAGTLAEAWEAFREAKPVYVVSSFERRDVPGWLIGESTALFENFAQLLAYVEDHEQLKFDRHVAEFIRDSYLEGIYKGR